MPLSPAEYADAFARGETHLTAADLEGLCGRVMRGKAEEDFVFLAVPRAKPFAWMVGADGLASFLGRSGWSIVLGVQGQGPERVERVRKYLAAGNSWRLLITRAPQVRLADWQGLVAVLTEHDHRLGARIRRWQPVLASTPLVELLGVEGLRAANEVKSKAEHPEHLTPSRYLDREDTAAQAATFLLHCLGVNEHYRGTGHGDGGQLEYLTCNGPVAALGERVMVDLEVRGA